jgi:DNA-binding transcriptional LysR family regulator
MHLRDVEYFLTIVECGRIHAAADRLGLTQPALSKCVSRLEKQLGNALFARTEHGVELTEAGKRFTEHANALHAIARRAEKDIQLASQGAVPQLAIGVAPALAEYLLPGACVELLHALPGTSMKIVAAMNDSLMPAIRAGELDIAVSGISDTSPSQLTQELLMKEEFVVVSRREHPLSRKARAVNLEDVALQEWALSTRNVYSRQGLDSAFIARGFAAPRPLIETNSVALMLNVIAMSDALGFLPQRMLRKASLRTAVHVLRVRDLKWSRRIGVTFRALELLPPAGRKLLEILRRHARAQSELG